MVQMILLSNVNLNVCYLFTFQNQHCLLSTTFLEDLMNTNTIYTDQQQQQQQ